MLTLNNSFLINDYIIVNNIYIGKIIKRLWNGLGFIIKLENQLNYVDNTIIQYKLLDNNNNNNYTGYKMITSNDEVNHINVNNLYKLIHNELKKEQFIFIDEKLNKNYKNFKKNILSNYKTIITNLKNQGNSVGGAFNIKEIPEIRLPISLGITSQEAQNQEDQNQETQNQETQNQETQNQETQNQETQNQEIENQEITSLVTSGQENENQVTIGKGIPEQGILEQGIPDQETENQKIPSQEIPSQEIPSQEITSQVVTDQGITSKVATGQGYTSQVTTGQQVLYQEDDKNEDSYKLYIDNLISNLFTETKNPYIDGFSDGKKTATQAEKDAIIEQGAKLNIIKPGINDYLELFDSINKSKLYDFKTSIMYKHIITDNLDIISLGKEIINKIKDKLIDIQKNLTFVDGDKIFSEVNLFDFISFEINNGYIIIKDKLISDERIITTDLIDNLDVLKNQYGKPIDYTYLKGLIYQNKTTLEIKNNKCLLAEALKILSQEYIIALQPKVEYLIWAVIRLILCWYSSDVLNKNIYKIKILINLYRARGIKTFNKDNDVLPIIMVIPKYGKESALKVVTHLNYFFFPYRKLGWIESPPTYFNKVDDLLFYTNGSLNIKKYIKFLLASKESIETPFVKNYTKIKLTNKTNDIEYEE